MLGATIGFELVFKQCRLFSETSVELHLLE